MNAEQQAQLLLIARTDHGILSFAIEKFRQMFQDAYFQPSPTHIAEFEVEVVQKLTTHFAAEEQSFFPALLADPSRAWAAPHIRKLESEHPRLLAEARHLGRSMSAPDPARRTGEVWHEMLDFLTDLERHCAEEDQWFSPFPPDATSPTAADEPNPSSPSA